MKNKNLNKFSIFSFILVLTLLSGCKEKGSSLSISQLRKEFANPSNEWRGKPFWAWNGKLDEKELLRQVDVLDSMGFGGYFMHSRVGLQTEYLGDEWFDLTNKVADYGEQKGMENYLYDEDRWPSGTAGGYVTKNPDFRMNFMSMKIYSPSNFEWSDTLVAVFSCNLEGTSYSDLKRLNSKADLSGVKSSESILAFFREKAADTDFVNGYSYVDAMNRKATETFMDLTHNKYKEHSGERIGTSIKGIFIDEPHRGPLFTAFSNDNANRPLMAPWTDSLQSKYKETYGDDIIDQLPRLFLHENGANYDKVKWQYCNLTQQLFLDNFIKPLYEWCEENNMELTGHVLHEDDFVSQVSMQGSLMRTYEFMQVPGIDILTQSNKNYWVAKQLQSVARQTGKKKLLSELDGCTGWQMTFQDYKEIGDWQALFGINLRCPHLSWYTMEGEAKRDYPASINFQSGWWREYKYVEDYYARLGLMLSQGVAACDVLVISPIESVMAQVSVDSFDGLNSKSEIISLQQKNYADLFHWLEGNHIDFDYGDEEIMSRLGSVDKKNGKTVLRIGEATYETVFIGNMATIRKSTLNLLADFLKEGGYVICGGELPQMIEVEPSEVIAEILSDADFVPYEEQNIIAAIEKYQSPIAKIVDTEGNNISDIYCQERLDADKRIYAFMNMNPMKAYENVSITMNGCGFVSYWNCRDGKIYSLNPENVIRDYENNVVSVKLNFDNLREYVLMVTPKPIKDIEPFELTVSQTKSEPVQQTEFEYTLNEMNVLPLDFAYLTIDDKPFSNQLIEILKADRAIRKHYGLKYRGGAMLQPWFFTKYKGSDNKVYGNIELKFPFVVEDLPETPVYLCVETPQRFKIKLNGQELKPSDEGWWIDPCYKKIKINSSLLSEGENIVSLEAPFTEDLNLETIYLVGEFGVKVDTEELQEVNNLIPRVNTNADGILASNPRITKLPSKLKLGDIVPQGLPFYSGTISYNLGEIKGNAISIDDFVGACVIVRNGDDKEVIAFQPYIVELPSSDNSANDTYADLALTRRNTFGPLHQLPARLWAYAPEMFVSEGDQFTEKYVLFKTGLMSSPEIIANN